MSGSLGARAVQGVAWLGSGQVVRQLIAFGTNVVLARLLFPEDFGLFGMTLVAAEVAQLLTDFGIGAAIVQRRERDDRILATCFWLNLAVGCIAAGLLIAGGPWIGMFYGHPEVTDLMLPLAANMLIGAALVVPQALLIQELRFGSITLAQTLGTVAGSSAAIAIAASGGGVWALVLQPLVGNIATGAMLFVQARFVPNGRLRLGEAKHLLSFSGNVLGVNLLSCLGRNFHAIILGRQLGAGPLGLYNLASGITGVVIFQVSSVIVRVLFPTLSNLQHDLPRLWRAWQKASAAIALLAFPVMAGAIAVAPDLVPVVFGPQWEPAVGVLRILCLVVALQSVLTTSSTVLMALGHADLLFRTTVLSTIGVGIALWMGALHGVEGAATGYAVASLTTYAVLVQLACRRSGVSVAALVGTLLPYGLAAIAMAVLVTLVREYLTAVSPAMRLVACVTVGAASYSALVFLVAKKQVIDLIGDVRDGLR